MIVYSGIQLSLWHVIAEGKKEGRGLDKREKKREILSSFFLSCIGYSLFHFLIRFRAS